MGEPNECDPTPQGRGAGEWRSAAACIGMGADAFYAHKADEEGIRNAKRICANCPVRLPCLEEAVVVGEEFGVWGGLSEKERREARKPHKVQADTPTVELTRPRSFPPRPMRKRSEVYKAPRYSSPPMLRRARAE